ARRVKQLFFAFSDWLGDASVVVPGQWRRIIGTSRGVTSLNLKKTHNCAYFHHLAQKSVISDSFHPTVQCDLFFVG
ncbi:hypothetical protein, partial [Edwardsiella ictaluri]|uniref:hypothetical protein n=1 Tax=Edwardsiella ictaluri TaxID=67780 RepID=UPI00195528A6